MPAYLLAAHHRRSVEERKTPVPEAVHSPRALSLLAGNPALQTLSQNGSVATPPLATA